MRRTPDFTLLAMDGLAERADVRSGPAGSPQQLGSAQRCSLRVVLVLDSIPAALLAHMFAQQLAGFRIEQADVQLSPTAPAARGRSSLAARHSKRLRLRHSHPDARCARRIGNSGRVPPAVVAGAVSLRRTSRRPGVWWCRECACRPSVLPSDPDKLGLLPELSKRRPLSGVFLACPTPDSTFPLRSGS